MKKPILLLIISLLSLVAKPCQCEDDFFCSVNGIGPNTVIVYGHKIADIDTTGVVFRVLESWGPNTTADTITIWNDSIIAYSQPMGPGPVFQCSNDVRRLLSGTDTFILSIGAYYPGSAFGTPGDYVFYHDLCQNDILWVENGIVRDTNISNPLYDYVIEEPVADFRSRLENAEGCNYTRIINGLNNNPRNLDWKLYVADGKINVLGVQAGSGISLNLYNVSGEIVYSKTTYETTHTLTNIAPALYFAEIVQGNQVYRQKIVVQ